MIRANWTQVSAPEDEPITLEEAKAHARTDINDEQLGFEGWITAARQAFEHYCQRSAMTQTWRVEYSDWADVLWLPMGAPLQSVSSVQYYNEAGTLTTLATSYYDVETSWTPGRIVRKPNQVWPTLQSDRIAARVLITYVAGWANAEAVPAVVKRGMYELIGHFSMFREPVVVGQAVNDLPFSVTAHWGPYIASWRAPQCVA